MRYQFLTFTALCLAAASCGTPRATSGQADHGAEASASAAKTDPAATATVVAPTGSGAYGTSTSAGSADGQQAASGSSASTVPASAGGQSTGNSTPSGGAAGSAGPAQASLSTTTPAAPLGPNAPNGAGSQQPGSSSGMTKAYGFYNQTAFTLTPSETPSPATNYAVFVFSSNPNFCSDLAANGFKLGSTETEVEVITGTPIVQAANGSARQQTRQRINGDDKTPLCEFSKSSAIGDPNAPRVVVTTSDASNSGASVPAVLNVDIASADAAQPAAITIHSTASHCDALANQWPVFNQRASSGNGWLNCIQ